MRLGNKNKKVKKVKNKKAPIFKRLLPVLISFIPLIVITFGTFYSIPSPRAYLRPLSLLPVPPDSHISLPGELTSKYVESSVLGAETINPRDIVTYVNEERMKRGIRPLRVNETLTKAAQMRAAVILKHQNFSHQDPFENIQLDTVLPLLHYPFNYASENIGMGDSSGRAFVSGFMNSPPHRANLLNPELIETGVAIVSGPYKEYYVNIAVHIFAKPWDAATYQGYTSYDENEYKQLLADIGKQLEETKRFKEKDPENFEFYDQWQRLLIRQQEIISTLSHAVQEDKSYGREMIALIKEYNANWASVPITD